MGGCVLGTSQPSFELESEAKPNLLARFSPVSIAILLNITIFLQLEHQNMIAQCFFAK